MWRDFGVTEEELQTILADTLRDLKADTDKQLKEMRAWLTRGGEPLQ